MAVYGRGSLKKLQDNATLSKSELTKLEKEAEKKAEERRKLRESSKKAPPGSRRSMTRARRSAKKNIPKALRDLMISPKQDAQNKGDAKLKTENRTGKLTGTRGPQKPASKGTLSQITKTAEEGLKLAKKLARATGVLGLLSADKLGDGSLYKGKTEAEVSRIIERKAKAQKGLSEKAKKARDKARNTDATGRSDRALKAKATAYKKTGEEKYKHGKSAGGVTFKEAFRYWKRKGNKTFTWNGKKYSTETK